MKLANKTLRLEQEREERAQFEQPTVKEVIQEHDAMAEFGHLLEVDQEQEKLNDLVQSRRRARFNQVQLVQAIASKQKALQAALVNDKLQEAQAIAESLPGAIKKLQETRDTIRLAQARIDNA